MSWYKGESETSESEHSHGNKASCDEETYGDSHSSENSDEKKKSNLEKLIFVDNIWLSCLLKRINSSLVQSLPLASLYTSLIYITAT
jgi:hypothetical protein